MRIGLGSPGSPVLRRPGFELHDRVASVPLTPLRVAQIRSRSASGGQASRCQRAAPIRSASATSEFSAPKDGKFLSIRCELAWLSSAQKLGVTTLWLGTCLWFLRGLKGSDSFLVSNMVAQEWGLLPDAKSRALRKLEMAGLIAVERRGKRSPRVTLVLTNFTTNQTQGEPA